MSVSGTVYIDQPGSKKLIVSGGATETVLKSSMGIPQPLEQLSIEHGAVVKIDSDLTVEELLWSETSSDEICKLIVGKDNTLTVTTLGDPHKGVSCNIEIEDGSALSGDTLLVAGTSPKLDVSGHLDVNSVTIYNKGIFNVASTAELSCRSLTLSAWSVTQVELESLPSFEDLVIGFEAEVNFQHELVELQVTKLQMDSGSKLTVLSASKTVTIDATEVILHDSSSIDVSQGGDVAGLGVGSNGKGASHGGEGGGNSGNAYGKSKNPTDKGSGNDATGGGGVITINTATAILDGNIISDGKDSSSGGSILISATTSIEGHGYISASGGDGGENGGGGGRIALITQKFSSFHGKVVSYDGSGSSHHGAAGTIYEEYVQSGNTIKNLILDNNNKETDALTVVIDVNDVTEFKIFGHANAVFDESSTNPIVLRRITGDYTSVLTLKYGQRMEIATAYGTIYPYALQCKLVVTANTSVKTSPKLYLKGGGSNSNNLELSGTISNLQELVIASGGRAVIYSTSQTGSEPVGTLSLNKLDIMTGGKLFLATDTMDQYTLKVTNGLDIKYDGNLTARNLLITNTPYLQVADNGLLNVDGGSLDGSAGNGENGAGASHGGAGGASEADVEPSVQYVGELHSATEAGSVGGHFAEGIGGAGGGILKISQVMSLTLNGKISADGKAGVSGGGGGSGGAISLTDITDISGSGTMSVKGGHSDSGGGGGRGRIKLEVTGNDKFEGDYSLQGGSSIDGGAGGSGTASVRSGTTVNVYIDNSDITGADAAIDGKTVIHLEGETYSYVDKLDIGDGTIVHFITEHLHFKAKSLPCGAGSMVIVDDNVTFSADTDQDYSILHCSFDLYEKGELRLAPAVELAGEKNQFAGKFSKCLE